MGELKNYIPRKEIRAVDTRIKILAIFGLAVIVAITFYGLLFIFGWIIADNWYDNNPTPDLSSKGYVEESTRDEYLFSQILRLRIMVGALLISVSLLVSWIILFVEL